MQRKTFAFKENALVYDLFDYPSTDVVDPYTTPVTTVRVAGAGTTAYNGVYDILGNAPDGTIIFKLSGPDLYLYYSEDEWRLGITADPSDEDFAYYSTGTDDIWGVWTVGTGSASVPTIFVDSVSGKKTGFGFGDNAWGVETSCFDFGIKTEALTYSKNDIDLKVGPKHLFSLLSPGSWPDVAISRRIDYKYLPSRLLTSNKLGKNGSTLWSAYVVQPVGSLPAARWFGIRYGTSDGWFGRNYNGANWGVELPTTNSTTAITADVTHLIVKREVWAGNGSKTVVSLWVDPTPAIHPLQNEPAETADINEADMTAYTFDQVYLAFSQVAKFGSYRLGETFFSVAPGQRGLPS